VISPRSGSEQVDRVRRVGEYARAGIPVYWIVDLEPEVKVTIFTLHGGGASWTPVSERDVRLRAASRSPSALIRVQSLNWSRTERRSGGTYRAGCGRSSRAELRADCAGQAVSAGRVRGCPVPCQNSRRGLTWLWAQRSCKCYLRLPFCRVWLGSAALQMPKPMLAGTLRLKSGRTGVALAGTTLR
jgi:Putative restriction endonuclease